MLKEDDALATEAASKKDEDGTGLEGGAGAGWLDGFVHLPGNGVSSWNR